MKFWKSSLSAHMLACRFIIAGIVFGSVLPVAHASFYKCIGANGNTTYNDAPCAADENTQLLSKSARQLEGLDCRIARNFAFDAVARMRQDDSATAVFKAYGGASKLSNDARNLINHVYTFDGKYYVSSQRIVDLTVERCRAGLLGKALDRCESFPAQFINRYGSCIDARQNEQSELIKPISTDRPSGNGKTDSDSNSGTSPDPMLGAARPHSGSSVRSTPSSVAPGHGGDPLNRTGSMPQDFIPSQLDLDPTQLR